LPATQFGDDGFRLVHTWFSPSWIVRSALPQKTTVAALRAALARVDSELPFNRFRSLGDVRDEAVSGQRLLAGLLSALAAIAVLLAMLGVYGLVSSSVLQRRRELGVRVALGATPLQVLKTATGAGMALGAVGIAVGLVLAMVAARTMQRLVFGVSTSDPVTFSVAAGVLAITVCVATLVPAIRILRMNVVGTLRQS
jgi:putative ABC transport system permease protein